jgi:hypothetical protein
MLDVGIGMNMLSQSNFSMLVFYIFGMEMMDSVRKLFLGFWAVHIKQCLTTRDYL